MSRVGKLPVPIPEKVSVSVDPANTVTVEGPRGKLSKSFDSAVEISVEEHEVVFKPKNSSRHAKAMFGTARSVVDGMVLGVVGGYTRDLEIEGVGFRAAVQGKILNLALGYSHPINYNIPEGIQITVADNTKVNVAGIDKQLVGQVAADIKHFYPVEPYKGKGVRIVGDYVRRKEGKKAG